MSNYDYVPAADAEFNVWQAGVVTDAQTNAEKWGINADDLTKLVSIKGEWDTAWGKAGNRNNRLPSDVQAKNDARKKYEKALRDFVGQWLSKNPRVTDADRTQMGLTVKNGSHSPVVTPETSPVVSVDFSTRLQHSVYFADEATPQSKAKPEGVHGCEVWMKTGGSAPVSEAELLYKGVCTRSPFTINFPATDVAKMAYYWLRWVNSKGETGPWSSQASAIVAG